MTTVMTTVTTVIRSDWRRRRESNPCTGLCRPLPEPLGYAAGTGERTSRSDCAERARRYDLRPGRREAQPTEAQRASGKNMTVQLLGVGASAPRRRVAAADVAAAWGRRGGRGHAAVCPADEDTLTSAWEAGTAALTAAGIDPQHVDRVLLGNRAPALRRGTEPSRAQHRARLFDPRRRNPERGFDATPEWTPSRPRPTRSAAGSAQYALGDRFRRRRPGPGTAFEPRCGAGAAAIVLAGSGGTGRARCACNP